MQNLSPQYEVTKRYDFEVAGMPAPIEIIIEQASDDQSCSEAQPKRRAASRRAVHLSLGGLIGGRRKLPG